MSKKPTRSRHRVPTITEIRSDPIDDRYQREVDHSVAKLEQRYRRAQKALDAAERRAERARTQRRPIKASVADLERAVEDRRRELREIEALMMPAAYNNRDSRRRTAQHHTGSA